MVAAIVAASDANTLRRDVRALVLPGQRRIRFTKESDERQRLILSRLTDLGVRRQVFQCATKGAVDGRAACLTGLVAHAAEHSHTRIVLERDMLWTADAIAWSYTKGGDWGRRAKPMIAGITTLQVMCRASSTPPSPRSTPCAKFRSARTRSFAHVEPKDEATSAFTLDEVAGIVRQSTREGVLLIALVGALVSVPRGSLE